MMSSFESIPMRELERLTGITRMTINFYIKEGLLPQPRKTARNMAYYDQAFIDRLQLILKLKTQNHLSLAQIKKVLKDLPEISQIGLLMDVRDRIFKQVTGSHENKVVDWAELIEQTGLDENTLLELQNMHLIFPEEGCEQKETTERRYHYDSVVMGQLIKAMLGMKITLAEIKAVTTALRNISQLEAVIYQRLFPSAAYGKETSEEQNKLVEITGSFTSLAHMHQVYELVEKHTQITGDHPID
jgi:DNA-binding transcriptional MerR regulator